MLASGDMLSSNSYATFVVGFAIMTDSMIYTLVLPFLPDLFAGRLHVPQRQISQWTALAFEVFAVATLLSNLVVGFFADTSASKSRPFLISVVIMAISTIIFFLGTTPTMILVSRAIQGASTTFTWVTGLAYLVAQVGEGELGAYVGWTTVGVAIGEIIGPLVGGPIYDYFGHWAAFGVVEALLVVDIILRVLAKDKKPEIQAQQDSEASIEQESETNTLFKDGQASPTNYNTMNYHAKRENLHRFAQICYE
ncbi:hypothetical protein V498_07773 [Pseudogymnoascus sp. VKM F-4517 (FW-2822)]|nr:hypothetical protein V498_07773 [Pseudogymnoascus sp. VKM F-4517 (FW-2822)]